MQLNENNIQIIRDDFPILKETVYGKPLIYFDNAATTHKPESVLGKIEFAYHHLNANIHRGTHYLSQQATEAHETARSDIARFIGAGKREEIVFTRGTTESINLIAFSYGEAFCKEGDEILISAMEHHSNIVPWQMLCERKKMRLRVIPILETGEIDLEAYGKLLNDKTRLVAVTHISNVLGTVNPIQQMIDIAHQKDIPVLVDGAQAIPHVVVDVQDLDADFYVFSGHKVYGPTGIGILYGKEQWLNQLPPYQGGGEMIEKVSFEKTTYNELPFKFEAGTPDYIGSTALAEALRYIGEIGLAEIAAYEHELTTYATRLMSKIPDIQFIGTAAQKSAIISFMVKGIHPYDIGMLLDKLGIAVRTGHHCAQPLMDYLEIPGTIRVSFAFYNTKKEIDVFIAALERVLGMLGS